MKKDAPREFLKEYEARSEGLESTLKNIMDLLKLRLGQLSSRTGTRAWITDFRVKRPAKLWAKAKKKGLSIKEAFTDPEDVLGVRIVCNNLSDIEAVINMIREECSLLSVSEIKDMVMDSTQSGYRAIHVRTRVPKMYSPHGVPIPCEIQIRTLAQDTWARLSRADLYEREVPASIQTLTQALSKQLSAIDEIAQLIRDELNKKPEAAESIKDSDHISPTKLALLYEQKSGSEIYEWTLIDWVRALEEAEVRDIWEVRALLEDVSLRKKLDSIAQDIRGFGLEEEEWVVFSALVASEISIFSGIRAVRKRIQKEWVEITSVARREVLPETIEKFVAHLENGTLRLSECLSVLDCFDNCARCSSKIFRGTDFALEAVLDYYEQEEDKWNIGEEIGAWSAGEGYWDGGDLCDYCQHIWEKMKEE